MPRPRQMDSGLPGATQLQQMIGYLRRLADAGRPMPPLQSVADALFLPHVNRVTELLRQGRERGLIVVDYGRNGIASVAAADGAWLVERGEQKGGVAPRAYLRCRRMFQPAHRHNFLCGCPEVAIPIAPRGMHTRREVA